MNTKAAMAAKAIKEELKKQYPTIKFSVRSKTYSGGNSISVECIDGPAAIRYIIDKYEMGHFDGMQDLYEYSNTRDDIPQVKYVFYNRIISEQAKDNIIKNELMKYKEVQEKGYNDDIFYDTVQAWGSTWVYRIHNSMDIIPKGVTP